MLASGCLWPFPVALHYKGMIPPVKPALHPVDKNCRPEEAFLLRLAFARMPFGKYKDRWLSELPEAYLCWFQRKGWPQGELGLQLASMLEIATNGQCDLLRRIRQTMSPPN